MKHRRENKGKLISYYEVVDAEATLFLLSFPEYIAVANMSDFSMETGGKFF